MTDTTLIHGPACSTIKTVNEGRGRFIGASYLQFVIRTPSGFATFAFVSIGTGLGHGVVLHLGDLLLVVYQRFPIGRKQIGRGHRRQISRLDLPSSYGIVKVGVLEVPAGVEIVCEFASLANIEVPQHETRVGDSVFFSLVRRPIVDRVLYLVR